MAGIINVPTTVTDPQLRTFLQQVKTTVTDSTALLDLAARRASAFERSVNIRLPPEYDPNTVVIPNPPWDLTATGMYRSIMLMWYGGSINDPQASVEHTEIWRSATDDLSTAVLRAVSRPDVYTDAALSGESWYYWVRFINLAGVPSLFNAVNGTLATAEFSSAELLAALSGKITASQLHNDLRAPIESINAPGGIVATQLANATAIQNEAQTRNTALLNEASARVAAMTAEANARATALTAEADARASAILNEATARQAALVTEAQARATALLDEGTARVAGLLAEAVARDAAITTVESHIQTVDESFQGQIVTITAAVGINAAAIQTEQQARTTAIEAEVLSRTTLATRVDVAETAITTEQTARSTQDLAIAGQITTINTSLGTNAAAIQTEQQARSTAIEAEALSRTTLATRVTNAESAIGAEQNSRAGQDLALAGQITTLATSVGDNSTAITNEINNRTTAVSAEATARNTLSSKIIGAGNPNNLSEVSSGLLYEAKESITTLEGSLVQQMALLSAGSNNQFDHTKIWYFDTGVEGWVGNGTPTIATVGWLRPANHATDPYTASPVISISGAVYPQVRARIKKTGTPVWAGQLFYLTATDTVWGANGKVITITEPTYDSGVANATWNVTGVWLSGTVTQIRLDLSNDQSATDYFEIDWIAVGRPSPGASSAELLTLQSANTSANSARVLDIANANVAIAGKASTTALEALDTRVDVTETGITTSSTKLTKLASQLAQQTNCLDTSQWVVNTYGSQGTWAVNGVASESRIIQAGTAAGSPLGVFGQPELLWECTESGDNDASGGYNVSLPTDNRIDKSRGAVFATFVRHNGATSGSIYHGFDFSGGITTLANAADGNPYAVARPVSDFTADKWYLLYGVIHPSGSATSDTGLSGVYDCTTGERILAAAEFRMSSTWNACPQTFRNYWYYSSDTAHRVWFARPLVLPLDTAPSPLQLMGFDKRSGEYSTAIDDLTTTVNHSTTGVTATATKVVSLETKVNDTNSAAFTGLRNSITANTFGNIDQLASQVTTLNGSIGTKASSAALSDLTQRVTTTEGVTTAQAGQLTVLTAQQDLRSIAPNPVFNPWTMGASVPTGWSPWYSLPTRYGTNTPQFNIAATENAGMYSYVPGNYPFIDIELTFTLLSGTLTGAGILIEWVNTLGTEFGAWQGLDTLYLAADILNKRTTAKIRLKRPNITGTFNISLFYVMVNYAGYAAKSAKNIIIHSCVAMTADASADAVESLTTRVNNVGSGNTIESIATKTLALELQIGDVSATAFTNLSAYVGTSASGTLKTVSTDVTLLQNTLSGANTTAFNQLKSTITQDVNGAVNAVATRTGLLEANSGLGGANLIPGDTTFDTGVGGWYGQNGVVVYKDYSGVNYVPPGLHQIGASKNSTGGGEWFAIRHDNIPVTVGKRYAFSANVINYRCYADMMIIFRDSGSAALATVYSGANPQAGDGASLADWPRLSVFGTAPAGTHHAVVLVYFSSYPAVADYYGWVCRPMLEEASSLQTVPSAWKPSEGGAKALVAAEESARIIGTNAVAYSVNQLTTAVKGDYATVEARMASVDGIQAQWGVKTQVGDLVGGVGLLNKDGVIDFMVSATRFSIFDPTSNSKVLPFIVQDGVVYIDGVKIATASIDTGKISNFYATSAFMSTAVITDLHVGTLTVDSIAGDNSATSYPGNITSAFNFGGASSSYGGDPGAQVPVTWISVPARANARSYGMHFVVQGTATKASSGTATIVADFFESNSAASVAGTLTIPAGFSGGISAFTVVQTNPDATPDPTPADWANVTVGSAVTLYQDANNFIEGVVSGIYSINAYGGPGYTVKGRVIAFNTTVRLGSVPSNGAGCSLQRRSVAGRLYKKLGVTLSSTVNAISAGARVHYNMHFFDVSARAVSSRTILATLGHYGDGDCTNVSVDFAILSMR